MSSFRYSRWDGTQQIMPFDADAIMDALSDDILAHGDIKRALEKLMQQGHRFQTGEKMPGLRDLLDRIKQSRQDTLRHNNMDAVVNDIRQRLEKIKEAERAGIDRRVEEGRQEAQDKSAATRARRKRRTGWREHPRQLAGAGRNVPEDAGANGQPPQRAARQPPARSRRADQGPAKSTTSWTPMPGSSSRSLLDMLQQQMVQNTFSGLQQGMQKMQHDPKAMEAVREMVHDLNQMLRDHQEGRDPHFNEFMQKHGHHFPPGIENLDQLMEHLAAADAAHGKHDGVDVPPAARPATGHDGRPDAGRRSAGRDARTRRTAWHADAHGRRSPVPLLRRPRRVPSPCPRRCKSWSNWTSLEKLERELNAARRGENLDDIDRRTPGRPPRRRRPASPRATARSREAA